MIAQAIRSFDRSPVPGRSIALRSPGSKRPGQLSDYVDEFDPFAGVFALFLLLGLLTGLFVLQLGIDRNPPPPPLLLQVALVPEPMPAPVITPSVPPPTTPLKQRDSVALGKGDDSIDTGKKEQAAGRPVVAPFSVPSENRLLNEAPQPMSSKVVDPKASTAATPVPFSPDATQNNADKAPRSASAETPPAGTVQQAVVPTAPEEDEPGGPKNAGQGAMMAAGLVRGPKPPYPLEARREGVEGKVMLRVTVNAEGRVTSVTVVASSGHDILDRAARDGVAKWRFSPAHRAAGAIASVYDVPIEFKLNN